MQFCAEFKRKATYYKLCSSYDTKAVLRPKGYSRKLQKKGYYKLCSRYDTKAVLRPKGYSRMKGQFDNAVLVEIDKRNLLKLFSLAF